MLPFNGSLRGKNALKLFLKVLERQNIQNQKNQMIKNTDEKKSNYFSNPKPFSNLLNVSMKKIMVPKRQLLKLPLLNLLKKS